MSGTALCVHVLGWQDSHYVDHVNKIGDFRRQLSGSVLFY